MKFIENKFNRKKLILFGISLACLIVVQVIFAVSISAINKKGGNIGGALKAVSIVSLIIMLLPLVAELIVNLLNKSKTPNWLDFFTAFRTWYANLQIVYSVLSVVIIGFINGSSEIMMSGASIVFCAIFTLAGGIIIRIEMKDKTSAKYKQKVEKKASEKRYKQGNKGDAKKTYKQGKKYAKGGDYGQAFECYLEAAELGNADAMCDLAILYQCGRGGMKNDYDTAYKWYKKSAECGSTRGRHWYAQCYADAIGVPRDYRKAAKMFEDIDIPWKDHCISMAKQLEFIGGEEKFNNLPDYYDSILKPNISLESFLELLNFYGDSPHYIKYSVNSLEFKDSKSFSIRLDAKFTGKNLLDAYTDVSWQKFSHEIDMGREYDEDAASLFMSKHDYVHKLRGKEFEQTQARIQRNANVTAVEKFKHHAIVDLNGMLACYNVVATVNGKSLRITEYLPFNYIY